MGLIPRTTHGETAAGSGSHDPRMPGGFHSVHTRAAPRGPGPLTGPTRAARSRSLRSLRTVVCAPAPSGGFLRPPRAAGPLRCPRPLRRGAPAACCAARPAPRLPRSASCALPRSVGARCRRLPAGPPSRRCGLPVRSPLLCLGLALAQRVGPPGPPGLLCGAAAPAPGPARPYGPLGAVSGPGASGCAPAPARACWGVLRPAGRAWPPCRAFVAPAAAAPNPSRCASPAALLGLACG